MRLRIPHLVLAGSVVLGLLTPVPLTPATDRTAAAADAVRFADVDPSRFFGDAVEWAHGAGIVEGVTPACFAPEREATRAEVAAVLQRLLAPEADETIHGFADVRASWQQVPVAWMAARGITTGVSPTAFAPDEPATRAMIAAFLWRIEGRPGSGPPEHGFSDVRPGWQEAPVDWMWRNGITTGRSRDRFAPDEAVTRGELLTFIWRWQNEPNPPAGLTTPEPIDCLVATGTCADLFPAAVVAEIDALAAGRRVTAHVHDHRTDCTYELHPGLELTTASVIKAQVLAGVLLAAQEAGTPVSAADRERIRLMMHYSHNSPPTSQLYATIGGPAGMERLDGRFAISGTSHTARYGATVSTAADRTRLVEQLLIGGGPLDPVHVDEAWQWMRGVSVAQSWGLSAGLPAGHDVALKNGFYPMSGRGWRVGTTGVVRPPGGGAYAVSILSDGNATESAGIALVEAVARRVNGELTLGTPERRGVDDVVCVGATGGATWGSVAATLGVTDLDAIRRINGGESAPLAGQRVCAP